RVHVAAARNLEGVVVEADVALAVLALAALRVGGGDPEQRLAVAPAGHVGVVVFELEAEKAEQLAVEVLRAREVADAEHQVIDADDAGHGSLPRLSSGCAHHTPFVIAGHSASLRAFTPVFNGLWTRVNALMTRQSIVFAKFFEDDGPPEIGFTRFRAS